MAPLSFSTMSSLLLGKSSPSLSPKVLQVGLPEAYGTFLIGSFLGMLLFGLSTHQTYRYIRAFPTDAAYIRLLVIVVMVLETFYIFSNIHTCFFFLVTNYANAEMLKHSTWSLNMLPMLGGMIIVLSQTFFVRRVSMIGRRHRILAYFVVGALVGEFGFSTAATVLSFASKMPVVVSTLSAAALFIASFVDTILSIALVLAIRASRSQDSQKPESVLDIAQVYIINSGITTGVFHILGSITAVALPPGNLLYAALVTLAVMLYANTLLSVLNSRELHGMEFLLSVSFSSVTLDGAAFADEADLWNVPKEKLPRARVAGASDKPVDFTDPWGGPTRNT